MSKFNLSGKASKQAVEKAQTRGGSRKRWKMTSEQAAILVVGPVGENEPVFGLNIQHIHFGTDKSFICKAAAPEAFEQKDKLKDIGWKLKNKYDPKEGKGTPHPNAKIKDLWKSFMPKKSYTLNIIDMNDVAAGVQQYDAPMAVMDLLFDEINDNEGDLTTICDFNQGRKLLLKRKGSGFTTKYVAKFSANTAKLDLDPEQEDALAEQVVPLSKIQDPFNEVEYEKVFDYLAQKAKKLGIDLDDLDEDTNDEIVDDAGDDAVASDEFDDDSAADEITETDDDIIEDDVIEDEPAPAKPQATTKPVGKAAAAPKKK